MQNGRTKSVCSLIHLLSLALWGGGSVFFSFVAAPRTFGYLRDRLPDSPPPGLAGVDAAAGLRLAGNTVGAIFPTYFAMQIVLGVLALAAGIVLARGGLRLDAIRCGCVAAALALVTLHSLTVYAHSVRVLDRHYEAKDSGDERKAAELRKAFGMFHGVSQVLNLVTIALVVTSLGLVGVSGRRD